MTNENTNAGIKTDAYYAEKGKVRFMMVTTTEHKAELVKRCKELGVSHGALLEIFLDSFDQFDLNAIKAAALIKRQTKMSSRVSFSSINKKLKGLTKEQLQAVEKAIEEVGKLAVS